MRTTATVTVTEEPFTLTVRGAAQRVSHAASYETADADRVPSGSRKGDFKLMISYRARRTEKCRTVARSGPAAPAVIHFEGQ